MASTTGGESPGRGRRSLLVRLLAVAAVAGALVVVAFMLLGAGGGYELNARFINSGRLVQGNEVRIGGVAVGSVTETKLADNGEAIVKMRIGPKYAPIPRGTEAVIRMTSLSGIANRYVDLQQPNGASRGTYPDGATIPSEQTTAAVEIDEIFHMLDAETREDLQEVIKGSAEMFEGRAAAARRGYRYLHPALSTSNRLFSELASDTVLLERFITDSARLVTTLAARRQDLSALVGNLSATTRAASQDSGALAEVLQRLPGVMRQANTTFVGTRATLDDLRPLVDDAKPVARMLQPFLPQLRRFVDDAEPTVRDLSRTIRARGGPNDLIDVLRTLPPLADVALDTEVRNGKRRPGAFPQTRAALRDAQPIIAFGRRYTPDLVGWFDDFSHTGSYDALGGFSRSQVYFNLFSLSANGAPRLLDLQERAQDFLGVAKTGQYKRCPGYSEIPAPDGSNVYTPEQRRELDCKREDRAVGP